ncbi:MAG: MBL fold metallo-hydrolase [Candidatus Cloacimonadales bacterium]|nr:MBL fold metallo-hydrolase [Candidatus Cloacimonadales bacterium]
MFQTSVLASGSKGNSIFIRTESTQLILDAGLSGKKIISLLESIKINPQKLNAVIVSHEHGDHVSGVGILCRRFNIPLYITRLTYSVCCHSIGRLPAGVKYFETGQEFTIGDLIIKAFPSSHDVIDGSNFVMFKEGDKLRKLAIATDLGYSSNLLRHNFKDSSTIILESNHDVQMLLNGPYPPHLKQRIKSRQGHLSNEQAVGVITQVLHPGLKNLILAHLSEKNNLPDLAYKIMSDFLKEVKYELNLLVSSQYEATGLIDV